MAANDASGNRLLDMALEDGAPRAPLSGLFPASLPLPSLEDALMPLAATLPHLHPSSGRSVKIARKQAKRAQAKHPNISMDKCIAIVLYTMEEIPREDSLYYALNLALRNQMRNAVRPWRGYVWLLLHALRELPPAAEMLVFRGCKTTPADLGLELTKGFDFTWSSFSSTATQQDVMQTFVGQSGPRTLMTIKMTEPVGRDVRDFSLYPGENEILYPPNMCFEVVSSFDAGNQLIMVQCEQTETIDAILDLSVSVGISDAKPGTAAIDVSTLTSDLKTASGTLSQEAVQALLAKLNVTDVNQADGNNWTQLMHACSKNDEQCALALIKAGANINATEEDGYTALIFACQNGHEQCALALIKAGANLESKQNEGWTALMYSAQNGHEQCALALIKAGAAVDKQGPQEWTALMFACSNGHEQCALELLKAGADPNKANNVGETPLFQACGRGHEQCALELLKAKARKDLKTNSGETALDIAKRNGHTTIVKILEGK